jgi:hypothetical protein
MFVASLPHSGSAGQAPAAADAAAEPAADAAAEPAAELELEVLLDEHDARSIVLTTPIETTAAVADRRRRAREDLRLPPEPGLLRLADIPFPFPDGFVRMSMQRQPNSIDDRRDGTPPKQLRSSCQELRRMTTDSDDQAVTFA